MTLNDHFQDFYWKSSHMSSPHHDVAARRFFQPGQALESIWTFFSYH